MSRAVNHRRRAFSLIELVIVIIIMGVISAIAIPRMMRGAEGADITGLQADLAVLRNAVEMYRYEHQAFPALVTFETQLTTVTQGDGSAWATGPKYGPYLIKMPPLKTGTYKDESAHCRPRHRAPGRRGREQRLAVRRRHRLDLGRTTRTTSTSESTLRSRRVTNEQAEPPGEEGSEEAHRSRRQTFQAAGGFCRFLRASGGRKGDEPSDQPANRTEGAAASACSNW